MAASSSAAAPLHDHELLLPQLGSVSEYRIVRLEGDECQRAEWQARDEREFGDTLSAMAAIGLQAKSVGDVLRVAGRDL
jgi:hypothetical protein